MGDIRRRASGSTVPAVAKGEVSIVIGPADLVLGIAVVAAAELQSMFALGDRQSEDLVIVLGAIGPWIVSGAPVEAAGAQTDVGQTVHGIVRRREVVAPGGPAGGYREAASALRYRHNGDFVSVVVERALQRHVGGDFPVSLIAASYDGLEKLEPTV